MDESSESEFLADFGVGITEPELDSLLLRARADDDQLLRLLVKQFRALRRAAGWLMADIEENANVEIIRNGASAKLTRFLISNDTQTR